MIARQILAIVAPTVARGVRRWIFHVGGLGFIPLGLLDNSVIPLPHGCADDRRSALPSFEPVTGNAAWAYTLSYGDGFDELDPAGRRRVQHKNNVNPDCD
jgi:hypothetical protein